MYALITQSICNRAVGSIQGRSLTVCATQFFETCSPRIAGASTRDLAIWTASCFCPPNPPPPDVGVRGVAGEGGDMKILLKPLSSDLRIRTASFDTRHNNYSEVLRLLRTP
jgi:hypothetical protein